MFKGDVRELGRASRLLEGASRRTDDRPNQHPGVCSGTRAAHEPTPARAGRDTKASASTQGTGGEPKANQPGRTKAVVATHSTAGRWRTTVWKRGEPRPKGPTTKAERRRDSEAGHDLRAKERQERHRAHQLYPRNSHGLQQGQQRVMRWGGAPPWSPIGRWVLTNRMSELFTYGSVGGAEGNLGSYPAPND